MKRKTVSGIMLTLLLTGMLTLAFNIQPVKAESKTWTVDDDGPADFSSIQEAINSPDVKDGDTIYVYNGSYYENVVVNKAVSFIGESRSNTIIDGSGTGTVVYISESNISISGFTMQHGYIGICLASNGNKISGNTITLNGYCGITDTHVRGTDNNSIVGNEISNSEFGIHFTGCDGNTISGNTITLIEWGQCIYLSACTNNTICNNILSDAKYGAGIYLWGSSNTISDNLASNNRYGIFLKQYLSKNNRIISNQIINNEFGIYVDTKSNDNIIFHNNFINNTIQVHSYNSINTWDDGYPSGGNYWSDYTDEDLCSGPGQNEPGSDGVWDHPYVIDSDNQDNYPLVHPWGSPTGHIYSLVRDIKSMGLRERVEDGLVGLLEDAVEFLEEDREVLAIITMVRFILRVQMYRWFGLLTKEQASHLTTRAMEIIHLRL